MLTESKVANIEYVDSKGERSTRIILPVTIPKDTIKALDVSDLAPGVVKSLSNRIAEYNEYMATIIKSAFTFENWVDHQHGESLDLKWRTFKVSEIVEID